MADAAAAAAPPPQKLSVDARLRAGTFKNPEPEPEAPPPPPLQRSEGSARLGDDDEGSDEGSDAGSDAGSEPAQETVTASVNAANTLKQFPLRMNVLTTTIQRTVSMLQSFSYLLGVLLLVFLIHQIFLWIDQDPEAAFDRAAVVFEAAEITYDTSGILVNAAVDVLNAAVVPLWNSASYYLVEPVVILVLELFMLVFTKQHYTGVFSEADFPYMGLDCGASLAAATWCGRFNAYQQRLESAEKAPFFVNESDTYAARRQLYDSAPQEVYVFGIATARRLSELSDGEAVAPAFEMEEIVQSLDSFSEMFITLGALISDLLMGTGYVLGSSAFSVIIDGLMSGLKGVFGALRWLIKSGLFTTVRARTRTHARPRVTAPPLTRPVPRAQLINIGVEFMTIMITELMIPTIFAAVDLLMCVLDLFKPEGWQAQFDCGAPASPLHAHIAGADRRPRAQSRRSASRAPTPAPTSSSSPRSRSRSTSSSTSSRAR